MKESDIRVDDNLDYRWSLYKRDQQKLLNKNEKFVEVNCPACEAKEKQLFYERDGFTFYECQKCFTVYVNPRPTVELLIEHYKNSEAEKYFNENIYSLTEQGRIEHLIKPRLEKIYYFCKKFNVETKTFLDVGAGYGTMCEIVLQDKIFENVIAVEPDPSPAQICRNKGIAVLEEFVENIELNEIADVVTSIENIEHVFSPDLFLKKIYSILKNNGILILSTPNIKGFDLFILKDKSDNTTAPDHLNYFHPESIKLLLEKNNFEVLELITPGKLDVELVRKKCLEGKLQIEDRFLKKIIIDEYDKYGNSFQQWLAENGLSSHMWIIARKVLK